MYYVVLVVDVVDVWMEFDLQDVSAQVGFSLHCKLDSTTTMYSKLSQPSTQLKAAQNSVAVQSNVWMGFDLRDTLLHNAAELQTWKHVHQADPAWSVTQCSVKYCFRTVHILEAEIDDECRTIELDTAEQ